MDSETDPWAYAGIAELQAAMGKGALSARALVQARSERIRRLDPLVRAVVEVNPDAESIARELDDERRVGRVRGPLHGIPVLLKDNIDTGDRMMTTAGSTALIGPPATADATVAARLRAAGAVLLGKTNLSEWANFRGHRSTSGWSGRGQLTRNPHALDRSPGGSSSGSGAAVAAGFAPAALGTETDGSIVSPAGACGVVGCKPTVGLTSRAGVVPISASQDTVGPLTLTVADAAAVLAALCGADPRDPASAAAEEAVGDEYAARLVGAIRPDGLRGARLGVPRGLWGRNRLADGVAEAALLTMEAAGATIVDPAELPTADDLRSDRSEIEVMLYEFRAGVEAYLATRAGLAVRTLADIVAYNDTHADTELRWFGHELLQDALTKGPLTDERYLRARERSRDLGGRSGIDAALREHGLDALVAPGGGPAATIDLLSGDHGAGPPSSAAARAGYPLLSVPAGFVHGLPVNILFIGTAWSEPVLLRLGHAFEQATRARRPPAFAPTLPLP